MQAYNQACWGILDAEVQKVYWKMNADTGQTEVAAAYLCHGRRATSILHQPLFRLRSDSLHNAHETLQGRSARVAYKYKTHYEAFFENYELRERIKFRMLKVKVINGTRTTNTLPGASQAPPRLP